MVYFSILSKYVIINRSDYRSSDRRDTSLFKPFTMLEFTPMGLYVIRSFLAQNLPPPFLNFHYRVAWRLQNIYLVSTAIFPSSIHYMSVISSMYGETGSEKGISFLGCIQEVI